MKLSDIRPNPNNPRIIRDERFAKLKNSIEQFPKMMHLRPIVVDSAGVILGGNMRLRALQDLGFKEIPDEWVKRADDLTEEEKQRFIIADNVGFGEWEWETLANEWEAGDLEAWGLDVPGFGEGEVEAVDGDGNDPFNDSGIAPRNQYGVIVMCESAGTQESVFNDLVKMGFNCKIVVT